MGTVSLRGKLLDQVFFGKDPLRRITIYGVTGTPTIGSASPFVYNSYDDTWYIYSQTDSTHVKIKG